MAFGARPARATTTLLKMPVEWMKIAGDMQPGDRVVVRNRANSLWLRQALGALGKVGGDVALDDGRRVVTNYGTPRKVGRKFIPLLTVCRECQFGHCYRCFGVCECPHGEFIQHVGYHHGATPVKMRTFLWAGEVDGAAR
tara:strand:- start:5588 stop:6007 length:420 start_codon:yes stop_codon:yes gene_type:complete